MQEWQVIGLLSAGFALLVIAVFVRVHYGEKYALKSIELVLIVIPLLVALLVTGKVKGFDIFGDVLFSFLSLFVVL